MNKEIHAENPIYQMGKDDFYNSVDIPSSPLSEEDYNIWKDGYDAACNECEGNRYNRPQQ